MQSLELSSFRESGAALAWPLLSARLSPNYYTFCLQATFIAFFEKEIPDLWWALWFLMLVRASTEALYQHFWRWSKTFENQEACINQEFWRSLSESALLFLVSSRLMLLTRMLNEQGKWRFTWNHLLSGAWNLICTILNFHEMCSLKQLNSFCK